jgi:hypothetical protein
VGFLAVGGQYPVDEPVQNSVDEAARSRLRDAILAEDGDEEQLDGVLRMLGEKTLGMNQLPLFGKAPAGEGPVEQEEKEGEG